ncbi:MAG: hypothetical protein M0R22_04510 [Dehalococcoidia bacterium]|jgi:hypothetical protein|nr:hypothetical protein [Dehalococcoidia bacterium]
MWLDTYFFGVSPSTPTATWADDGDGTGGVVTITGSLATATNTIYLQTFDGELGTATWTSHGSRTGNGTVSVTANTGHYLMQVVSVLGAESLPSVVHYIAVTSSTEAVQYQCMTAIQVKVQALSLSGVATASVVIREVPSKQDMTLPAVVIAPQKPTVTGITNVSDDYTYGIFIAIFAADNRALTANTAKYAKWLQQITRAFQNQRLSAVAESVICTVEPMQSIPFGDWANNIFAGGVIVRCRCREGRGLT